MYAVNDKMAIGPEPKEKTPERVIGRYAIYDEIASGGMAVVHLGRMLGQAGFSRTVAIKRLHPQFAKDPSFVAMFLDEARLAVRVQHPNVVAPLDVLVTDGEVLVVMEYVAGDTLARLQRSAAAQAIPPAPSVVVGVMSNALYGLHAAHEAVSEDGRPLHIVHRDISPQNIMVGTNGVARVLDFGVARAAIRSQATSNGEVRGKLAYMAPEQLEGEQLDLRVDVFAAGIVTWELLTQRRLFNPEKPGESMARIVRGRVPSIRKYAPNVPADLEQAVLKALQRDPKDRHQTARDFATALERACSPATLSAVADWVKTVGGDAIAARAEHVAAIETQSSSSIIRRLTPPPRMSGMVPVQAPLAPLEPDAKSRITIPLVRDSHSDLANVLATSTVKSCGEASQGASAPTGNARHLRPRTLATLLVSLVTGLVATVLIAKASNQPAASIAGDLPKLSAPQLEAVTASNLAHLVPARHAISVSASDAPNRDAQEPHRTTDASATSGAVASLGKTVDHGPASPKQGGARAVTANTNGAARPTPSIGQKAKANCSPPYVVDSKGIRRLRPECI